PAPGGPVHVATVSVGEPVCGPAGERVLGVHLLDADVDLVGRALLVALHLPLRPQRAFGGAGELAAQLERDVAATRRWALGAGLGGLLGGPVVVGA
ncbi:riboflavin kinase, partial [Kineococcus indalonis]|uniref:riboflavin kinase n=1 Tax=Kineococcus indalonis TaxID=2696566 RepID=UPI00196B908E